LRRVPDGIQASAIRGEITGLAFGAGDAPATLGWRRLGERDLTRFEGTLESDNLAGVLRAWDLPGAIESERATFATTLEWDDRPWKFSARALRNKGYKVIEARRCAARWHYRSPRAPFTGPPARPPTSR
jgi:hypothetical protein